MHKIEKSRKKNKHTLLQNLNYALLVALLSTPSLGMTAPLLDSTKTNTANISTTGKTTNIEGTQKNNTIHWEDFSIKNDEEVLFDRGNKEKNYLNIVTGATTSFIDGKLTGGNNIYLLNPNGIIFGKTASVNVGNLYLSTRPAADNLAAYQADTTGTVSPINNLSNMTKAHESATGDIVNLGKLNATNIVVEGNTIRFQNASDIKADKIRLIHRGNESLGYEGSEHYDGYAHIGYKGTLPTNYENTTKDNFYKLIKDRSELENIKNDLSSNYMLANDIDLGSVQFTPIGDATHPFTGKIDGMFHRIQNLNIESNKNGAVGLFGVVKGENTLARLENLGIISPRVHNLNSKVTRDNSTGALAGHVEHTIIRNVYVEGGEITGGNTSFIGGIVGSAGNLDDNIPSKPTKILSSYNTAKVSGSGIVGGAFRNIVLQDLYNTGDASKGIVSYNGSKKDPDPDIRRIYTTQGEFGPSKLTGAGIFDSKSDFKSGVEWYKKEKYAGWDDKALKNSSTPNLHAPWRIYEGRTLPLLTAFMQGTIRTEYSYTHFEKDGTRAKDSEGHYSDIKNSLGKDIAGSNTPEYNSKYIHIINKNDAAKIGTKDDISYSRTLTEDDKKHIYDTVQGKSLDDKDHNLRNAGTKAILWSDQHGYELAGTNIEIKKRKISFTDGKIRPVKVYDGKKDATKALKEAFKSGDIKTSGITTDDQASQTVTINADGVQAEYETENAGNNIKVNITGSFGLTGKDSENYEIETSSTGKITGIGNIDKRKIYLKVDVQKSIDKVYDGTSSVTKAQSDDLKTKIAIDDTKGAEHLIINSNAQLAANNTTPDYVDSSNQATKNVAEAKKVCYSGIKLEGSGKDNYTLLYNDAEVANDTIYLAGKITPRRIDSTSFQVTDEHNTPQKATKVYDGTSNYTLPTGSKLVAPLGGVSKDTGVITTDQNKIDFTLARGEFRTIDGNTPAKTVNTAKKIAYQIKAHTKNLDASDKSEAIFLQNYSLGTKTENQQLQTNKLYDVFGDSEITKRILKLKLDKKNIEDKTYDGKNTLATDIAKKANAFNQGYITYADDTPYRLLKDDPNAKAHDNATITVEALYAEKNVKRDTGNQVIEQDVNYHVTLSDTENYALTTQEDPLAKTEIDMYGKGKILPLNLKNSFKKVRKEYDGTTVVTDNLPLTNPLEGIIENDDVKVGSYDSEFFTKDVGSGSKAGDANYIKYENLTFTGSDVGNYILPEKSTTGYGEIYKKKLTDDTFKAVFKPNSIEKTYDNTKKVEESDKKDALTALEVDKVTHEHPTFSVEDANYKSKNVKDNKRGIADNVTFDIAVDFSKVDKAERNYDFTALEHIEGQKYRIKKKTNGIINPKEIEVQLHGKIKKTYDGMREVTDGNRNIIKGDALKNTEGNPLITLKGLIAGDTATHAAVGTFDDKNAGTDKDVTYTLQLSNTDPENYVFKLPSGTSGTTIKGKGDILKRDLKIKGFTGTVTKTYDAKNKLTNDENQKATPIYDDGLGKAVIGNDTVTLQKEGTFGTLQGTTFTPSSEAGTRDIEYTSFTLGGADAQNYNLLTQKAYGTGTINPRYLTSNDFSFETEKLSKVYDGKKDVEVTYTGQKTGTRHVTVKVKLDGSTWTDFRGTYHFRGTYDNENAGTNKSVTYHVEIYKNASKNYTFDSNLANIFALQDQKRSDGEIKKRPVYFDFVKNLQKEYDGDTFVKDKEGNTLQGDHVIKITPKTDSAGLIGSDGVQNDSKATYKSANSSTHEVVYTPQLSGSAKDNYVFYRNDTQTEYTDPSTTSDKTFNNFIKKRILSIVAGEVQKTYDGLSTNSDTSKLKVQYKNGTQKDVTNTLLPELQLQSDYGLEKHGTFSEDANAGKKRVRYQNIAFKNSAANDIKDNYTFDETTIYGDGIIDKLVLDINTNFDYEIEGAKKTYDGSDNIQDANRFAKVKVKVKGKTITLSKKDYNVRGRYTGDINAGTNKEGTYTFTIKPLEDTSDANITYKGTAKTETKSFTNGEIKKRPVYFTMQSGFSKIFDNKKTVEKNEETLKGNDLITLEAKHQTTELDRDGFDMSSGLVGTEKNTSTATYESEKAGTNKRVKYTITLDKNSQNYEFRKAGESTPADLSNLYTDDNTIEKRRVVAKIGKVEKIYDGTSKNDDFSKITYEYEGKDTASLPTTSTIINTHPLTSDYVEKTPAGDTKDASAGDKSVRYEGFQSKLLDQDNYAIEDTFYGEGTIKRRRINGKNDLNFDVQKATKTYDATRQVVSPEEKIKISLKAFPHIAFDEFSVQEAAYEDENAGTNKKVHYKIDVKKQNMKNFILDDDFSADFETVDNEIYRRILKADLKKKDGITKIYDGEKTATTDNLFLTSEDLAILQRDREEGKNIVIQKEGSYDDENATISPTEAVQNQKTLTYTIRLQGEKKDTNNYTLSDDKNVYQDQNTYTGKGDIIRREVFVKFKDGKDKNIDKKYDGTTALPKSIDEYKNDFVLVGRDDTQKTGIVEKDRDIILDTDSLQGAYTSKNVQRDRNGKVIEQDVHFHNLNLKDADSTNGDGRNNYVFKGEAKAQGTITPRTIFLKIQNAPAKTYDGTRAVLPKTTLLGDIVQDRSDVLRGDSVNLGVEKAEYHDKNAGKHKDVDYHLTLDNQNYALQTNTQDHTITLPLGTFTYNGKEYTRATLTYQEGEITPKEISVFKAQKDIKNIDKTYDGTRDLHPTEKEIRQNIIKNDLDLATGDSEEDLNLTLQGVYTRKDAATSEDVDPSEQDIDYEASIQNTNYRLKTNHTKGKGTIKRKELFIKTDNKKIRAGDALPPFTGTVRGFISGEDSSQSFTYQPQETVDTSKPATYDIYGWYKGRTSGNFGKNYTFSHQQKDIGTLTVELLDPGREYHEAVNPLKKFIPDDKSYQRASHDEDIYHFYRKPLATIEFQKTDKARQHTKASISIHADSPLNLEGEILRESSPNNSQIGKDFLKALTKEKTQIDAKKVPASSTERDKNGEILLVENDTSKDKGEIFLENRLPNFYDLK